MDAARRQPNDGGDNTAHVIRDLGAGANYQAIIFIPIGNNDMIFDGGLLHLRDDVIALNDQV